MYLDHWDLQKAPYGNVPSSEIFFRSPQHEEALRRLMYAVEYRKGVAMLTGEVGCGKTTVTKALKKHLNKEAFQLRTISNPALQPTDLIKAILLKLGDRPDNGNGSKTVRLPEYLTIMASRQMPSAPSAATQESRIKPRGTSTHAPSLSLNSMCRLISDGFFSNGRSSGRGTRASFWSNRAPVLT